MILRIVEHGYFLPFHSMPPPTVFGNHRSALNHADFVEQAITDLLSVGSVQEVRSSDLTLISPLGVVPKKNSKLRLILDLRFLNQHLHLKKFKYEDLLVASQLVSRGDWFVTFDLKNGYHHIDIGVSHRTYLGFSFRVSGRVRYFQFASLPFGLATAPYIFTKVLRPLVKHWRREGKRVVMYLDDGFGVASSEEGASSLSHSFRTDLSQSGFLINEDKSHLVPHQRGEYLGYLIDLHDGTFQVPHSKVQKLMCMLNELLEPHSSPGVSARSVARVSGTIISMGLALGPVARLFTRHMYALQNSVSSLNARVELPDRVIQEIHFWIKNFDVLVGQPIWHISPKIDVITYSDASSTGWAGYAVQLGDVIARGEWDVLDSCQSSTFRELKAVRLVLESFASCLAHKECKHRSDNQSTVSILATGSNKEALQREATRIYALCRHHGIRLFPEWIPRNLNHRADYWSKVIDTDDWMLNPVHFLELDQLWGPHTVDCFASFNSKQLPKFYSRWFCPGCAGIDAFTLDWSGDNNWLVPPIHLVARVLRHLISGGEAGTLVVPFWPSAPWWPLLMKDCGTTQDFVVDYRDIPLHPLTFLPGSADSDLFGSGTPDCRILALRIQCSAGDAMGR